MEQNKNKSLVVQKKMRMSEETLLLIIWGVLLVLMIIGGVLFYQQPVQYTYILTLNELRDDGTKHVFTRSGIRYLPRNMTDFDFQQALIQELVDKGDIIDDDNVFTYFFYLEKTK